TLGGFMSFAPFSTTFTKALDTWQFAVTVLAISMIAIAITINTNRFGIFLKFSTTKETKNILTISSIDGARCMDECELKGTC
ncbi:MAG: hypothetical protein J6W06_10430, partial [Bacteroidales bacterium]|nr:hypothetical protein [Bacteroidales bacterium]